MLDIAVAHYNDNTFVMPLSTYMVSTLYRIAASNFLPRFAHYKTVIPSRAKAPRVNHEPMSLSGRLLELMRNRLFAISGWLFEFDRNLILTIPVAEEKDV